MSDRKMGAKSNHPFGEDDVQETVGRASDEAVTASSTEHKQADSASTETTPKPVKRNKGGRAKRAPGAPSRPLSAYNLFFKEQREIIIAERTAALGQTTRSGKPKRAKISFEELAKLIGSRWKNVEADELERFKAMAQEDAIRYKAEMDAYIRSQREQEEKETTTLQPASAQSSRTQQAPVGVTYPASFQAIPGSHQAVEQPPSSSGSQPSQPDLMMSLVLGGMTDFLQRVQGPTDLSSQVRHLGSTHQQPIMDQIQLVNFGQQQEQQHSTAPPSHQNNVQNNFPSSMPTPVDYRSYGNNLPSLTAAQSQYSTQLQNQSQQAQLQVPPQYQDPYNNLSQYSMAFPTFQQGVIQQPAAPQPQLQQQFVMQPGAGQGSAAGNFQFSVPQQPPTERAFENIHHQQLLEQQMQQMQMQMQHQVQHMTQQQRVQTPPSQATAPAASRSPGGESSFDASLIQMLGDNMAQANANANTNGSSSGESSSQSWMNPRPIAPLAAAPKPPSPPFEEQKLHGTTHGSDSSASTVH